MNYINRIHVLFGSVFSHKSMDWWKKFLYEQFNVESFHGYIYTLCDSVNLKRDVRPILIKDLGCGYYHGDLKEIVYQPLFKKLHFDAIGERDVFLHVTDKSNIEMLLNKELGDLIYHHLCSEKGLCRHVDEVYIKDQFKLNS